MVCDLGDTVSRHVGHIDSRSSSALDINAINAHPIVGNHPAPLEAVNLLRTDRNPPVQYGVGRWGHVHPFGDGVCGHQIRISRRQDGQLRGARSVKWWMERL